MTNRIRVLIAEDSATARDLIAGTLEGDDDIEVVGLAKDGIEAVEKALALKPDVITMDVNMPRLSGLEATRRIMAEVPTPIVIVSGTASMRDTAFSLSALSAGALSLLQKLPGPGADGFESAARELVTTVKLMARVKVVRRRGERPPAVMHTAPPATTTPTRPATSPPQSQDSRRPPREKVRAVAIAASTGGTTALHTILLGLPRDYAVPIVVVQHMAAGFLDGFARWLGEASGANVRVAVAGETLSPGRVYIAPEDNHLEVTREGRVVYSRRPAVSGFRPSGTVLFDSMARSYGASLVGVILTGMGRDGVDGLRTVRAAGGLVIAQDEATSIVWGMNGAAVLEGLVDVVLPLPAIAQRLIEEVR